MKWWEWAFSGVGVLGLGLLIQWLRRRSHSSAQQATFTAQGARVSDSPVASGTGITQNVNSPTFNVSLPSATPGAARSERYNEWRELIQELHESFQIMANAFHPILPPGIIQVDEPPDYHDGIQKGYRVLRNRILIANVLKNAGVLEKFRSLVEYTVSARTPRDPSQRGCPTRVGFDLKTSKFEDELMELAQKDSGLAPTETLPATREAQQAKAVVASAQTESGRMGEDQSSWPDVILECQWPSLVHESRIPGSHIVRKRPWMLRHGGPGAVYNVSVHHIDFGEYEARFPCSVRTLTDTASIHPIICWKSEGQVIDAHDLESLIHNPPSGCDVQQYAVKTYGNEDEEIRLEDFVLEVEIPVTISYDDKNGNRFKIKYLLHYDTYMEKGEMIRIGGIEKVAPI